MTKNEQILFDLLKAKEIVPLLVWYEFDIPLSHYSGWFFSRGKNDTYRMGKNMAEAKENIELNNFEKIED